MSCLGRSRRGSCPDCDGFHTVPIPYNAAALLPLLEAARSIKLLGPVIDVVKNALHNGHDPIEAAARTLACAPR